MVRAVMGACRALGGQAGKSSPESMTFKLELRPEWNFSRWRRWVSVAT